MEPFRWIAFFGAWLLFAGPVYQAAIELREQSCDHEEDDKLKSRIRTLPPRPHISRWWWLLPPLAYIVHVRTTATWKLAMLRTMTKPQRERFLAFQNKATGWMLVAAGALFIAMKETAELVDIYAWPRWVLLPLLSIPGFLGVAFTVYRLGTEYRTRVYLGDAVPHRDKKEKVKLIARKLGKKI